MLKRKITCNLQLFFVLWLSSCHDAQIDHRTFYIHFIQILGVFTSLFQLIILVPLHLSTRLRAVDLLREKWESKSGSANIIQQLCTAERMNEQKEVKEWFLGDNEIIPTTKKTNTTAELLNYKVSQAVNKNFLFVC